jgi:hypothetical protein
MPGENDQKKEFLIFKIERNPKVNTNYKFLGLTDTIAKAKKLIEALPPKETGRIVVLEKKEYFERVPAITLNSLNENLLLD